jgi:hypothetical protein
MDTQGRKRSHGDHLSNRQGAGLVGHDGMQPLRAGDSADQQLDDGNPLSLDGEITMLRAFYGSAIEAARRTLTKQDRFAAVRALRYQMKLAIRGATERRRYETASRRAARRSRKAEEHKPRG